MTSDVKFGEEPIYSRFIRVTGFTVLQFFCFATFREVVALCAGKVPKQAIAFFPVCACVGLCMH